MDKTIPDKSLPQRRTNPGSIHILQTSKNPLRFQGRFSPVRFLAILLGGIALAEVIAMIVVYFVQDWPYPQQVFLDATVMIVIIFPLLYYWSFKPLLLQIQQRNQSENILQARLRLILFANDHTLDELLQLTLDEMEALTGSSIGFFHFLEADHNTLKLHAWSTNTLKRMCTAEGKDSHYDVDKAGVWADAVRYRQSIIHNNYAALPNRKGMPDGHALVVREMVVPVLRDNEVKAILGLGNKPQDYTTNDMEVVATFADFAWDIVQNKLAETELRESEEKFRTLVDWTYDWEKWLDPDGNVIYNSPSCERITGYKPEEFAEDADLPVQIIHPDDREFYRDHLNIIHDALAGPASIEYRIVSRDGREHWIEHVCRPLYGPDNRYLGRRVSNREITERKLAEKKINDQHQKELILTGTIKTIQSNIARDLHDTVGQNISYLKMNLEHLSETQSNNPTKNRIQHMTRVANESYDLIRAMLAVLQTSDSTDPLSLFTRYGEQVAERASFQSSIASKGTPKQLSINQIRQLFLIYREALSNIEKYAHASQVQGEFTWNKNALKFIISDNGRGFDLDGTPTADHYGLKFMRDRAELLNGSLSIQSVLETGTKITVTVPYEYVTSGQSQ